MTSEPRISGEPPDDIRLLYENAIGNVEFSKRQQWWVAAQTLILYAGIFGLFISIEKHLFDEILVFGGAITIIAFVSLYFIFDYNHWRNGERERMDWIRCHYFSDKGKEAWAKKGQYRKKLRWTDKYFGENVKYFDPSYSLIIIIGVGGAGIIYRMWMIYQVQFELSSCWT